MERERAAELLKRERDRIERELAGLRRGAAEELSSVDQHLADQGSDLYEDELDEGIATRMREELEAIGRAESRLEEGTFGLSVHSGEAIPDARLEVVPWAELTVDEQSRLDHAS